MKLCGAFLLIAGVIADGGPEAAADSKPFPPVVFPPGATLFLLRAWSCVILDN